MCSFKPTPEPMFKNVLLFLSHWVTRVLLPSSHLPNEDGIMWDCTITRKDPMAIWPSPFYSKYQKSCTSFKLHLHYKHTWLHKDRNSYFILSGCDVTVIWHGKTKVFCYVALLIQMNITTSDPSSEDQLSYLSCHQSTLYSRSNCRPRHQRTSPSTCRMLTT